MRRVEHWIREGRTAYVVVRDEQVLVSYEIMASILAFSGFERKKFDDAQDPIPEHQGDSTDESQQRQA